jgi:peptidoglycan hydrolase CwlO-like protein
MADLDDIIEDLKQKRDELRVQIHLASREVKEEWEELEEKMNDFSARTKQFADDARIKETGEGVGEALKKLGREIKLGYDRIRDAVKD